MPDQPLVKAYDAESGAQQYVPEHFLDHPVLGKNLSRTPTVASDTPDETWTVPKLRKYAQDNGVDTTGATSKADFLAAIHNPLTPASGETNEE